VPGLRIASRNAGLTERLSAALVDDPPIVLRKAAFSGITDADLDELRQGSRGRKNWIAQLQGTRDRGGGSSRSGPFNSVFGAFIEITKSNLANVPARYIRKQTTVGGERFTPELKEMESKILGADQARRLSISFSGLA
jgi:DNA mismatch repair protein MutS